VVRRCSARRAANPIAARHHSGSNGARKRRSDRADQLNAAVRQLDRWQPSQAVAIAQLVARLVVRVIVHLVVPEHLPETDPPVAGAAEDNGLTFNPLFFLSS